MEPDSVEMEGQHSVSSLEEPKGDESAAGETSCSIPRTGPNNFLSKHRMVAAITLLQNQINFIQEELDQLDTFGESSIVCEELLSKVESMPDPLLPSSAFLQDAFNIQQVGNRFTVALEFKVVVVIFGTTLVRSVLNLIILSDVLLDDPVNPFINVPNRVRTWFWFIRHLKNQHVNTISRFQNQEMKKV
ncbi:hypothetical protein DKX38_008111 [Salix brachista]|uniref:G protein gamma domain-containing protein n=1 Tax=Salix brachista TaxID=2182728 RepID=A0A5N5MQC4_9ROSI|nr:hypothetical protein DKX38_008111 [Salix brachista]